MQGIEYILKGIEYSVYGYFAMASVYIFVFALAGHLYKKQRSIPSKPQSKIALLIPSYKEDSVIVEVAKSALNQNYQSKMFDVVVIADSLKTTTLASLKALPIILVEVSFEESTKAKALNSAMADLKEVYDYAIVLDADNIMETDFLTKMNDAFLSGSQIVQGHRKAKNLNTSYGILDAASEEINNHIFRKGHSALGLSSGPIGSGMGFDFQLFKSMMKTVNAIGGFDKELEFKFAKQAIAIEYLQYAVVFDEKTQKSSDFLTQRRRWLSTQFVYLQKYFKTSWKELVFKGNINFFDKVWQITVPPRILLLGSTGLFGLTSSLLAFTFNTHTNVSVYLWLLNLLIAVAAFVLSLPKSFYNTRTLKSIFSLPSAFVRMPLLPFKLKGANKKFIHTSHGAIKNYK
jgi:cellulose synthase/poly-beta-1,6-N-acetylglucosamine synthase-like glycosyltransferase